MQAPLLLYLGMHARVGSATSAFMIVFSASSNLVHYLISGVLEPEGGCAPAPRHRPHRHPPHRHWRSFSLTSNTGRAGTWYGRCASASAAR